MIPDAKRPKIPLWEFIGASDAGNQYRHIKTKAIAISAAVEVQEDHLPRHWCWLLTLSGRNRRVLSDAEVKRYQLNFGMQEAEEDNHEAGFVRKFWLPVDPQYRIPCPCKDEEQIKIGRYYTFSRKKQT